MTILSRIAASIFALWTLTIIVCALTGRGKLALALGRPYLILVFIAIPVVLLLWIWGVLP